MFPYFIDRCKALWLLKDIVSGKLIIIIQIIFIVKQYEKTLLNR